MKRVARRRCVARCGRRGADGAELERYEYDPAGNVLAKTVGGRRTAYAYDAANQLVSATAPDGVVTEFGHDAAGRMVREGARTYRYGWLDKVLSVSDGASSLSCEYHADGQLARASVSSANGATSSEGFLWDGLALVRRGSVSYVNGPHPGGGEVLASSDGAAHFNDVLGTTLGVRSSDGYVPTPHTAFGDVPPAGAAGTPRPAVTASSAANSAASSPAASPSAFFTGKPRVAGLGHAFLFRNYRADLSRWPTLDPIGYPDGWNGFAYGVDSPFSGLDLYGAYWHYLSFGILKSCDDTVFIVEAGLPLEVDLKGYVKVSQSFFQTVAQLIANKLQGDIQKVATADLYRLYADPNLNGLGSNPLDPTDAECYSRASEILENGGIDYSELTLISKELLGLTYSASKGDKLITIEWIKASWFVHFKYWVVEE